MNTMHTSSHRAPSGAGLRAWSMARVMAGDVPVIGGITACATEFAKLSVH